MPCRIIEALLDGRFEAWPCPARRSTGKPAAGGLHFGDIACNGPIDFRGLAVLGIWIMDSVSVKYVYLIRARWFLVVPGSSSEIEN